MEFERALFRIHQRTLESEDLRLLRLRAERALPLAFAALAGCWALSHNLYVGAGARCLPDALRRAGLWNATAGGPALAEDALLGVLVMADDAGSATKEALHVPEADLEPFVQNQQAAAAKRTAAPAGVSYTFAFERQLLTLAPQTLASHGFKVYNVSLSERCLLGTGGVGASVRLLEGLDGPVINEVAYTFRSHGHLHRLASDASGPAESWAWAVRQASGQQAGGAGGGAWGRRLSGATLKLRTLLKAVWVSALMSAITGFFIRVAVNGSAVLMFAAVIASRNFALRCGGGGLPSLRSLSRSFPWIGVHVGLLTGAGRPVWPLLRAHLANLLVHSFAYVACSLAWRVILYRKSSPEGFADQLFGLCSVLELFNLVFVRSISSAAVFPKLTFACLVFVQFYTLQAFYPCHSFALWTCTVACLWVMVYCLNHFEEPALHADPFAHTTPTAAHPRALYLPQLSGAWSVEAAPSWTMFWPPEPPASFPEAAMRRVSDEEYLVP